MIEYRVMNADEALASGASPDEVDTYFGEDGEDDRAFTLGIYELADGKITRLVGTDGGEPEDQTFSRDLRWVVGALNEAYQKGLRDGRT